jgi:probable F420-dependent oxidoreductase
MKVGVMFPTLEIGTDPGVIRDFAMTAEDLSYDHIMLEDHILGADPTTGSFRENGWHWGPMTRPGVTKDTEIHEPFVLMGFFAAATRRIGLSTGVLVLPQRQTALVAKQAAEVDLLSGGRLRLGVGAGWNPVEFEALGIDFESRGRREEEQIELLRQLWAQDVVDFKGRWDRVDHAGINPLPGREIPIWIGGAREVALKRAARLGDGYITLGIAPDEAGRKVIEQLRGYVHQAGRDPNAFGIDGAVPGRGGNPDIWRQSYEAWQELGVTHLTLRLANLESESPSRFIDTLRAFREAIGEFVGK